MEKRNNGFLARHAENENFNQYWYSSHTIEVLVQEISAVSKRAAFLSTPSVYFSLPKGSAVRDNSYLLDFDQQWAKHPNFVLYDFNAPESLPASLHGSFDCVVIDPPFITQEVWQKYASAVHLLLAPQGKIILSTISENAAVLHKLLGVTPQRFRPSIPNLVYQYNFFANYETQFLCETNIEVPDDD
ncbi:hypothetical protein WJX72_007570 [[Myrmecia] bisecta]|uniref:Uncharacterized protein n=1 Tax=[Myrmecia] bisecta TaxID=41462 RepID=A0AAW1R857_9CHLO